MVFCSTLILFLIFQCNFRSENNSSNAEDNLDGFIVDDDEVEEDQLSEKLDHAFSQSAPPTTPKKNRVEVSIPAKKKASSPEEQ